MYDENISGSNKQVEILKELNIAFPRGGKLEYNTLALCYASKHKKSLYSEFPVNLYNSMIRPL